MGSSCFTVLRALLTSQRARAAPSVVTSLNRSGRTEPPLLISSKPGGGQTKWPVRLVTAGHFQQEWVPLDSSQQLGSP